MEKSIYHVWKGAVVSALAGGVFLLSPFLLSADAQQVQKIEVVQGAVAQGEWKEFHSAPGKCTMYFPAHPEHVSEKMSMPEEGYDLQYDAYISSADKKTIFMLLVAQYPDFVDEKYAHMSLEAFLNGILTHNPGNQLLFADLVLVQGHEALDFFIKTGSVYFKGRALMVKNQLYLMAMECEIQHYDEGNFNKFVSSFLLTGKSS